MDVIILLLINTMRFLQCISPLKSLYIRGTETTSKEIFLSPFTKREDFDDIFILLNEKKK